MPSAFLFDCYPHPTRSTLVLWIHWGSRAIRREVPYQPDFCVRSEEVPLEVAERLLGEDGRVERTWRSMERLWLEQEPEEVLRVRPKRLQDVHRVAQDLRRRTRTTGLLFFDVDHQPESRWLWERGLWPLCRLHVGPEGPELRLHASESRLEDGLDGRWRVLHEAPELRIVHLDVEARAAGIQPGMDDALVAVHLRGHGGDVCFAVADAAGKGQAPGDHPQAGPETDGCETARSPAAGSACNAAGNATASDGGPGAGEGAAEQEQQQEQKQEREPEQRQVQEQEREREPEQKRVQEQERERRVLRALGAHLARTDPDVVVTRGGDAWDVPFLLSRIDALGLRHQVRLGRDPDPRPDRPDQEGKSMSTYGRILWKSSAWYLRGRWHIDLAKKSLDAEADRVDLWGILYLARVANRRAQDVNRNGAGYALQQMQIDEARARGVALPWKRNLAEDWKDAATLTRVDRGGQIMNPVPGLYGDVASCDFSGYYPSIIVRHNLSSDTINCACCPDGPLIPELGYHVCTRRQGHQSEILRRLQGHRRWAKAVLRRLREP